MKCCPKHGHLSLVIKDSKKSNCQSKCKPKKQKPCKLNKGDGSEEFLGCCIITWCSIVRFFCGNRALECWTGKKEKSDMKFQNMCHFDEIQKKIKEIEMQLNDIPDLHQGNSQYDNCSSIDRINIVKNKIHNLLMMIQSDVCSVKKRDTCDIFKDLKIQMITNRLECIQNELVELCAHVTCMLQNEINDTPTCQCNAEKPCISNSATCEDKKSEKTDSDKKIIKQEVNLNIRTSDNKPEERKVITPKTTGVCPSPTKLSEKSRKDHKICNKKVKIQSMSSSSCSCDKIKTKINSEGSYINKSKKHRANECYNKSEECQSSTLSSEKSRKGHKICNKKVKMHSVSSSSCSCDKIIKINSEGAYIGKRKKQKRNESYAKLDLCRLPILSSEKSRKGHKICIKKVKIQSLSSSSCSCDNIITKINSEGANIGKRKKHRANECYAKSEVCQSSTQSSEKSRKDHKISIKKVKMHSLSSSSCLCDKIIKINSEGAYIGKRKKYRANESSNTKFELCSLPTVSTEKSRKDHKKCIKKVKIYSLSSSSCLCDKIIKINSEGAYIGKRKKHRGNESNAKFELCSLPTLSSEKSRKVHKMCINKVKIQSISSSSCSCNKIMTKINSETAYLTKRKKQRGSICYAKSESSLYKKPCTVRNICDNCLHKMFNKLLKSCVLSSEEVNHHSCSFPQHKRLNVRMDHCEDSSCHNSGKSIDCGEYHYSCLLEGHGRPEVRRHPSEDLSCNHSSKTTNCREECHYSCLFAGYGRPKVRKNNCDDSYLHSGKYTDCGEEYLYSCSFARHGRPMVRRCHHEDSSCYHSGKSIACGGHCHYSCSFTKLGTPKVRRDQCEDSSCNCSSKSTNYREEYDNFCSPACYKRPNNRMDISEDASCHYNSKPIDCGDYYHCCSPVEYERPNDRKEHCEVASCHKSKPTVFGDHHQSFLLARHERPNDRRNHCEDASCNYKRKPTDCGDYCHSYSPVGYERPKDRQDQGDDACIHNKSKLKDCESYHQSYSPAGHSRPKVSTDGSSCHYKSSKSTDCKDNNQNCVFKAQEKPIDRRDYCEDASIYHKRQTRDSGDNHQSCSSAECGKPKVISDQCEDSSYHHSNKCTDCEKDYNQRLSPAGHKRPINRRDYCEYASTYQKSKLTDCENYYQRCSPAGHSRPKVTRDYSEGSSCHYKNSKSTDCGYDHQSCSFSEHKRPIDRRDYCVDASIYHKSTPIMEITYYGGCGDNRESTPPARHGRPKIKRDQREDSSYHHSDECPDYREDYHHNPTPAGHEKSIDRRDNFKNASIYYRSIQRECGGNHQCYSPAVHGSPKVKSDECEDLSYHHSDKCTDYAEDYLDSCSSAEQKRTKCRSDYSEGSSCHYESISSNSEDYYLERSTIRRDCEKSPCHHDTKLNDCGESTESITDLPGRRELKRRYRRTNSWENAYFPAMKKRKRFTSNDVSQNYEQPYKKEHKTNYLNNNPASNYTPLYESSDLKCDKKCRINNEKERDNLSKINIRINVDNKSDKGSRNSKNVNICSSCKANAGSSCECTCSKEDLIKENDEIIHTNKCCLSNNLEYKLDKECCSSKNIKICDSCKVKDASSSECSKEETTTENDEINHTTQCCLAENKLDEDCCSKNQDTWDSCKIYQQSSNECSEDSTTENGEIDHISKCCLTKNLENKINKECCSSKNVDICDSCKVNDEPSSGCSEESKYCLMKISENKLGGECCSSKNKICDSCKVNDESSSECLEEDLTLENSEINHATKCCLTKNLENKLDKECCCSENIETCDSCQANYESSSECSEKDSTTENDEIIHATKCCLTKYLENNLDEECCCSENIEICDSCKVNDESSSECTCSEEDSTIENDKFNHNHTTECSITKSLNDLCQKEHEKQHFYDSCIQGINQSKSFSDYVIKMRKNRAVHKPCDCCLKSVNPKRNLHILKTVGNNFQQLGKKKKFYNRQMHKTQFKHQFDKDALTPCCGQIESSEEIKRSICKCFSDSTCNLNQSPTRITYGKYHPYSNQNLGNYSQSELDKNDCCSECQENQNHSSDDLIKQKRKKQSKTNSDCIYLKIKNTHKTNCKCKAIEEEQKDRHDHNHSNIKAEKPKKCKATSYDSFLLDPAFNYTEGIPYKKKVCHKVCSDSEVRNALEHTLKNCGKRNSYTKAVKEVIRRLGAGEVCVELECNNQSTSMTGLTKNCKTIDLSNLPPPRKWFKYVEKDAPKIKSWGPLKSKCIQTSPHQKTSSLRHQNFKQYDPSKQYNTWGNDREKFVNYNYKNSFSTPAYDSKLNSLILNHNKNPNNDSETSKYNLNQSTYVPLQEVYNTTASKNENTLSQMTQQNNTFIRLNEVTVCNWIRDRNNSNSSQKMFEEKR